MEVLSQIYSRFDLAAFIYCSALQVTNSNYRILTNFQPFANLKAEHHSRPMPGEVWRRAECLLSPQLRLGDF